MQGFTFLSLTFRIVLKHDVLDTKAVERCHCNEHWRYQRQRKSFLGQKRLNFVCAISCHFLRRTFDRGVSVLFTVFLSRLYRLVAKSRVGWLATAAVKNPVRSPRVFTASRLPPRILPTQRWNIRTPTFGLRRYRPELEPISRTIEPPGDARVSFALNRPRWMGISCFSVLFWNSLYCLYKHPITLI